MTVSDVCVYIRAIYVCNNRVDGRLLYTHIEQQKQHQQQQQQHQEYTQHNNIFDEQQEK